MFGFDYKTLIINMFYIYILILDVIWVQPLDFRACNFD